MLGCQLAPVLTIGEAKVPFRGPALIGRDTGHSCAVNTCVADALRGREFAGREASAPPQHPRLGLPYTSMHHPTVKPQIQGLQGQTSKAPPFSALGVLELGADMTF